MDDALMLLQLPGSTSWPNSAVAYMLVATKPALSSEVKPSFLAPRNFLRLHTLGSLVTRTQHSTAQVQRPLPFPSVRREAVADPRGSRGWRLLTDGDGWFTVYS